MILVILLYVSLCDRNCEGTSITLSPLGTVTVCSGGQVLLTCERMSGSFLHWTVSAPHLTMPLQRTVGNEGPITSPDFMISFTQFNITLTSKSPLISKMLISNVTTGINGSNIYCSEDRRNLNRASMVTIQVIYKDDALQSAEHSLINVSITNHFFANSDVTVILQWPREDGAVYYVNILSDASYTELTYTMSHNIIITTNLTISYKIQYNVSIVSSLCGITTNKILNYVTCDHPPIQSLHNTVGVVMESNSPPMEGQFVTYTCPPGFIQTGPNASVCTGNGEWEPDPEEVDCIADCGVPLVNSNVHTNYSSTLNGSVLILTCESKTSTINTTDEQALSVTCHGNGNWFPDPTQFTCSSLHFTTATKIILGTVLGVSLCAMVIIITISTILYLIIKGFLHPKRVNRLLDSRLENTYHSYTQNSSEEPDPVQLGTLVYADIGPASFKKRAEHVVTLRPDDVDDRVEYALLNQSSQKPVNQANQNTLADDSLNLDTLLIQIRRAVTSRWYQLGEALEVSKDVLDRCSNYPPEESIVEILDQWLRKFPERPTWHAIATALRNIGLQQLAYDIERVYETGKLPVQVDDDSQKVGSTTALELPQTRAEITRKTNFNSCQDQDESAPPLPPKPPAGSDMPKKMLAPPRPPKYVPK